MLSRRAFTLDRTYLAAAKVSEERKAGIPGKVIPFDLSVRRKLALWASYDEKLQRACAGQAAQK